MKRTMQNFLVDLTLNVKIVQKFRSRFVTKLKVIESKKIKV